MNHYTTLDFILETFPEHTFEIPDGFEEAVIGIEEYSMKLVFSVKKCIEILIDKEEMTLEDAVDHFDFNVKGGYIGEKTPIWCDDYFNI
jgi:hypothetical protein